ncbi:hypothetical protein G7046_g4736 [Stylonectria norvegica]|nr:hypothetical protein G7046_g4736 [Stylonectria norvegica]
MAETKDFDVILVARSDGADSGPGYWPPATASSTPSGNSKKSAKDVAVASALPRSKPQMIRLNEDDPRFVEWKVKLGILLKQELCPTPDEGNPWYVQFPRGYWLYEKSKHLWVSGYPVKPKLFKSPQEFAMHLIWLLTPSMEYRDCCCVHCNAPDPPKTTSVSEGLPFIASNEAHRQDKLPFKVTPVPLPPIPGQPPSKPAGAMARNPSAQPSPAPTARGLQPPTGTILQHQGQIQHHQLQPQPQLQPKTQLQQKVQIPIQPQPQAQIQTPPQTQPQNQPQTQNINHHQTQSQAQTQAQVPAAPQPIVWALKSAILFRSGELVWYQNGSTWRLGMIAGSASGSYELLPIGHGLVQQHNVSKKDGDMRPFHAFTVPPVAIADLKEKMFDEIPWEAMFTSLGNDGNKRELLALDASKMAASKIDYSYSLWSPFSEDPNAKTIAYYGCFFGAERIEIGDTLRLRSLPTELNVMAEKVILGLRYIFTTKDIPGAVFFRGHIYQSVTGDVDPPDVVREENLPIALRDESQWRNSVSPAERWRWAIVKKDVVLKEQSIRGRFYPTHRLMPILNPADFSAAVAQGRVEDQYAHLNNRMDGSGRYIGRKKNRLDTLGASVPHTARFSLEQHVREEGFTEPMASVE